ncbi:MAG TPA: serine/threonine-protein kinase [Blastocatellia bacterium]|nr:serine/threonine-protein kinase [Blastocatellia bacterium]
MNPEQWNRVKDLFQSCINLDLGDRASFLESQCAGMGDVRREVESLLAAHQKAGGFMAEPAVEDALRVVDYSRPSIPTGRRIGPYKVIDEIGVGGMGAVYLAARADEQYEKQVAIKLMKESSGKSFIVSRFLAERQILANLNHPNIARLLDGGATEDGSPYLVMEYIEGVPIDQYANDRELSTNDRLKLFLEVLSAVRYAHANLVIHRDIKPGNILVTADGSPKLLDFGIAKILAPAGAAEPETQTVLPLMTPDYASPEQVKGQTISTSTDIYSLGVLLYRLLTGRHPYRFKTTSPQEIERVICEQEPERPSSALSAAREATESTAEVSHSEQTQAKIESPKPRRKRSLGADLDNVVMMALRKEPERRYSSVEQLAEDIRRYLEGRPVIAHKDSFGYRASKFVRRRRVGVAAGALVALTLVAGVVATAREARIARTQQLRAERRFNDVRKLANSFMFEIQDSVQNLAGSTPTRELLVTKALEYLDSLAQESNDDPALQRELATSYEKVGDIQGNPYSPNLGNVEGALSSYRKAVAIRESLNARNPTSDLQFELGLSYRGLGDILEQKADTVDCVGYYRKSLEIFEQLNSAQPNDMRFLEELGRAHEVMGEGLSRTDSHVEELQHYRTSLGIVEDLMAKEPDNPKRLRSVGIGLLKVADGLDENQHPQEATETLRRCVIIMERLADAGPKNPRAQREYTFSVNKLGELLNETEHSSEALETFNRVLKIREDMANSDPANTQAQFDLVSVRSNISRSLAKLGRGDEAVQMGQGALAGIQKLADDAPSNLIYQRNLAYDYSICGLAYSTQGAETKLPIETRIERWQSAQSYYKRAQDIYVSLRNRGALRPDDQDKPDQMSSKATECEKAISALNRTPHS